jgi:anti-sigma factor RsiW
MLNNLNCADCEEKLSDYIERSLAEDERTAVERHLHSCRSCEELVSGMAHVIAAGRDFPVYAPPSWLASRIVANTPPTRPSLRSRLAAFWQSLGEPRTALAIFTAAIVMGWVGGGTVREAVFNRAEGVVSCAYDHAIRSYYRSPVVIEIHSRLDQLMENS